MIFSVDGISHLWLTSIIKRNKSTFRVNNACVCKCVNGCTTSDRRERKKKRSDYESWNVNSILQGNLSPPRSAKLKFRTNTHGTVCYLQHIRGSSFRGNGIANERIKLLRRRKMVKRSSAKLPKQWTHDDASRGVLLTRFLALCWLSYSFSPLSQ